MPDAWTILKENSSLDSGDAWEHLNAQEGGSGSGVVLIDGLEIFMDNNTYDTEINEDTFEIEVDCDTIEIEIDTYEYEVEV